MSYYIGIDSGSKGYVAVIYNNVVETFRLPYLADTLDISALDEFLIFIHDEEIHCILEKVQVMGSLMGRTSIFSMARNYGRLTAFLELRKIPYQEISPLQWKKQMGLSSDKQESILLARKLFPNIKLRSDRAKKDNDNIAEALLLAEYCRRKNK